MNYTGGANKTHGQVERADRIDSFEAGRVEGWGTLTVSRGGVLPCEHFTAGERKAVELSRYGTLELERVPSGFGGSRAFWVCPRCGKRVRYLYFKGETLTCRECARLNYRSQQRTRDSLTYVQDGLKLAREKLHWEPPAWITPLDFPNLTPPCPPYMHKATYQRHLARFRRYQAKYERDSLREMLTILGRRFK